VSLPCETVAKHILPVYRSLIAKELIEEHNFTQTEAAEKLGTTQAAISQYLHSKRGYKGIEQFEDLLDAIQESASNTAKEIATGKMNSDKLILSFCELCASIREKGKIPI